MRPFPEIAADLRRIAAELIEPPPPPPPPGDVTIVQAGESIQEALNAAPDGHVIHLLPGVTYAGNLVIRKPVTLKTGGADALGTRRVTAADAPLLATIAPTNGAPLIDIVPGTRAVKVARVICDPANINDVILVGHADSTQTRLEQQPRGIFLHQIYMQASQTQTPKRGVALNAIGVSIAGCHIAGMKRVGQDTQAIAGWNGEGSYTVEDSYLEAAGETVMFGGADPTIPGLIAGDIIIDDSTLTKDMAWRGSNFTVKNLLELKAARRVSVRNCEFSNCWNAGQGGYAFMFTVQSQDGRNPQVIVEDVTVERCTVRNVGAGINILGYAQIDPSLQSRGFTFRNNWFQIEQSMGVQSWFLYMGREPRELVFDSNTIETSSTNALLKHEGPPVQGFRFVRNLVTRCGAYGFTGNVNGSASHRGVGIPTYLPGSDITLNAFGSFPAISMLPQNLHIPWATIAPLVVEGYGTGAVQAFGRTRA